MGILRLVNPLSGNVSAPRHRQARALESIERQTREALTEAVAVRSADMAVRTAAHPYLAADAAGRTQIMAAAIGAMIARGEHVPAADLELLRKRLAETSA